MDKKENNSNRSGNVSNGVSSKSTTDNTKDYISGDSTPSSSSHQFPWIATDPKRESKKSAQKTNS